MAERVLVYGGNRDLIRDADSRPLTVTRDPLPEVLRSDPSHTEALIDATGHKTLTLVQRYTEAAGREGMADSAIEKLIARPNGERNLTNIPEKFVKSDTNPKKGKEIL